MGRSNLEMEQRTAIDIAMISIIPWNSKSLIKILSVHLTLQTNLCALRKLDSPVGSPKSYDHGINSPLPQ